MIRIALLGYGKMGQMVERLATEQGDRVVLTLDRHNNSNFEGITVDNFREVDVAIDFSSPECVLENVTRLAKLRKNVVIGTTGWTDRLAFVKELARSEDTGILWSPNFSIGVNVF